MNIARSHLAATLCALACASSARAQQAALPIPSVKQGAFELEVRGIKRAVSVRFGPAQAQPNQDGGHDDGSDALSIDFVARASEGTRLAPSLCSLQIDQAVSQDGQPKRGPVYMPGEALPGWEFLPWQSLAPAAPHEIAFRAPFSLPSQAAHRLARLQGTARLAWITKTETWRVPGLFDKPDEAKQQTKTITIGGVPVTYRLAIARPVPPGSYDFASGYRRRQDGGYRVSILGAPRQDASPADLASTRGSGSLFNKVASLAPTLRLLDAAGRRFEGGDFGLSHLNGSVQGGVLEAVFTPTPEQAASKATPAIFEMEVATQIAESTLPFEFIGLPLPTMEPLPAQAPALSAPTLSAPTP